MRGAAHMRVRLFKQARIEDRMCARTLRAVQLGQSPIISGGILGGKTQPAGADLGSSLLA
jgi:hypothetical protein